MLCFGRTRGRDWSTRKLKSERRSCGRILGWVDVGGIIDAVGVSLGLHGAGVEVEGWNALGDEEILLSDFGGRMGALGRLSPLSRPRRGL